MGEQGGEAVCCSAPGKVLITGGYLVLERPNPGIVFTVNARFYSVVCPLPLPLPLLSPSPPTSRSASASTSDDDDARASKAVVIKVISPQFNSVLEYYFQWDPVVTLEKRDKKQGENKYVEKTLLATLASVITLLKLDNQNCEHALGLFKSMIGSGLTIHILGDNQFYSLTHQLKRLQLPLTTQSLQTLPPFLDVQSSLDNIPKTGLGSSAALVSSLTAALLSYFHVVELPKGWRTEIVHNLAQFSHCAAQGKIGSGFDISSAVFGSQVYSRFDPNVLKSLLAEFDNTVPDLTPTLTTSWDNTHKPFALPPGMSLVLGDVGIGSNTPSLVRTVLDWRATGSPSDHEVWDRLNAANKKIETSFTALHQLTTQLSANSVASQLAHCAELQPSEWQLHSDVGRILYDLRHVFQTEVREGFRHMGELSGAHLEPIEQTQLADATMDVRGCLIAGVPGAGGYDAIFAIALSPAALTRIESLWEGWQQTRVLPLVLREEPKGVSIDKVPTKCVST